MRIMSKKSLSIWRTNEKLCEKWINEIWPHNRPGQWSEQIPSTQESTRSLEMAISMKSIIILINFRMRISSNLPLIKINSSSNRRIKRCPRAKRLDFCNTSRRNKMDAKKTIIFISQKPQYKSHFWRRTSSIKFRRPILTIMKNYSKGTNNIDGSWLTMSRISVMTNYWFNMKKTCSRRWANKTKTKIRVIPRMSRDRKLWKKKIWRVRICPVVRVTIPPSPRPSSVRTNNSKKWSSQWSNAWTVWKNAYK